MVIQGSLFGVTFLRNWLSSAEERRKFSNLNRNFEGRISKDLEPNYYNKAGSAKFCIEFQIRYIPIFKKKKNSSFYSLTERSW